MYMNSDMIEVADKYIEEADEAFKNKELNSALVLVQNALEIYKDAGVMDKYTHNLNTLGVFYSAIGNQNASIDCYVEGLELCEEYNLEYEYNLFYNNIGTTLYDLKEYDTAIEYFEKTKDYLKKYNKETKAKYELHLLIAYMNLCDAYRCIGNLEKSMEYLELAEGMGNVEGMEEYELSFLVLKCHLLWDLEDTQFVYEHLDRIVNDAVSYMGLYDYVQDIKETIDLLHKVKAYDFLKKILQATQEYIEIHNMSSMKSFVLEEWIDYYQEVRDEEAFTRGCVDYIMYQKTQKYIERHEKVSAINMKMRLKKEERERKQAERASSFDALTEAYNRHRFGEDLKSAVKKCMEEDAPLGIGILDIDLFKGINDNYGHAKGDECLKEVSCTIRKAVNAVGRVYRYGGDEFIILVPNGTREDLGKIAIAIKNAINDIHIFAESGDEITITLSQGYASIVPHVDMTEQELLKEMDEAMYYVKQHGRNNYRIV